MKILVKKRSKTLFLCCLCQARSFGRKEAKIRNERIPSLCGFWKHGCFKKQNWKKAKGRTFRRLKTVKTEVSDVSPGMMSNGWSDTENKKYERTFLEAWGTSCVISASVDVPLVEQTDAVTSGLWFWFSLRLPPLCTASLRRLVHSTVTTLLRLKNKPKDKTKTAASLSLKTVNVAWNVGFSLCKRKTKTWIWKQNVLKKTVLVKSWHVCQSVRSEGVEECWRRSVGRG